MKHLSSAIALTAAIFAVTAVPAFATLKDGVSAPAFTAQAALGGAVQSFDLTSALGKGPVVLYFFPKAFTEGCTIEAHAFSDHIAQFKKLGATLIGVSGDDIATQKKFSTQECRSNFLVASDPGLKIAKSFDAADQGEYANRTSYVIAPDGKIVEAFSDDEPLGHISHALEALQRLKGKS